MLPVLFAWLHLAGESMLSRKTMRDYGKRLCLKVYIGWRVVTEKSARMRLQYSGLTRVVNKRAQFKAILAWMRAFDDKLAMERFEAVQALAAKMCMVRSMHLWKETIRAEQVATWNVKKSALCRWRIFRRKLATLQRTALMGKKYYLRYWLRDVRYRLGTISRSRQKGIDCQGLLLLGSCRRACRKWSRVARVHASTARDTVRRVVTKVGELAVRKAAHALEPSTASAVMAPITTPRPAGLHNLNEPRGLTYKSLNTWTPNDDSIQFQAPAHTLASTWMAVKPSVALALDERVQRRKQQSALKFWYKLVTYKKRRRLRNCLAAWKVQTKRLKQARSAFINRLALLLDNTRMRFGFNVLEAFYRSRQLEKTCATYLLLVRKSKIVRFWHTVTKRCQMERHALTRVLHNLSVGYKRVYLRYWRVTAGPRHRLGRLFLVRHALRCWSRCARSIGHYRRRVLARIFGEWYVHMVGKTKMRTIVVWGRCVLVALFSRLKQKRCSRLRRAFSLLRNNFNNPGVYSESNIRWCQRIQEIRVAKAADVLSASRTVVADNKRVARILHTGGDGERLSIRELMF